MCADLENCVQARNCCGLAEAEEGERRRKNFTVSAKASTLLINGSDVLWKTLFSVKKLFCPGLGVGERVRERDKEHDEV